MEIEGTLTYTETLEKLLKEQGEQALGLSLLHTSAELYTAKRNKFISIPVLCLSAVAGFGSVGSATLFNGSAMASVGIGVISMFTGLLSSLGATFQFARRSESHHNASVVWKRLYNFISTELALPRTERISATKMTQIVFTTIQQLNETSPILPKELTEEFKRKYKKYSDRVAFPVESNGLTSISIFEETTSLKIRVPQLTPQVEEIALQIHPAASQVLVERPFQTNNPLSGAKSRLKQVVEVENDSAPSPPPSSPTISASTASNSSS